jgi:hypothetical protein
MHYTILGGMFILQILSWNKMHVVFQNVYNWEVLNEYGYSQISLSSQQV